MRRKELRDEPPQGDRVPACSPARRVLTGVVLFTFVLQLGRFYLAASANQDLCPEQSPAKAGDLHPGHSHDDVQQPPTAHPDGGAYFQHCKEHVYSIGLTHVQPLEVPQVISTPWTHSASVAVFASLLPFPQYELPTPFHPPRHLS